MTGVENADGALTQYLIDGLNRTTVTIDADNNRTTSLFDAAGNLTGVVDGQGNLTKYLVDADNRQSVVVDALGDRTTSLFDAAGNLTETIDANGHATQYLIDADDRATVTIDALNARTTSYFDAAGNLTAVLDADNNLTTFGYDADNQQTGETDPLHHLLTNLYDAAGNLTSVIDRDGQTRDISYDADNRETGETWIVGGSTTNIETFTYDSIGDILTASNDNGTYTISYDALGRATVVQDMWGDTLTMTYDAVGQRTKVQDNFGGVQTSLYDAAGNLTQTLLTASGQALRMDITYNGDNQIATETRYSDLAGTNKVASSTTLYDAAGQITNIAYLDASSNSLASFSYLIDAAGRVTVAVNDNVRMTLTYDADNQLLGDGTTTVSYDATGNRQDSNSDYVYGTSNIISTDGTWNYNADNNGNIIEKTKISDGSYWLYSYDVENNLTGAQQYNASNTLLQQIVYKYDAFGNRISMAVTVSGTTTTTRFAVDGWNPALLGQTGNANFNVWADLDGSNNLLTRYLRGDEVDQLFARIDVGATFWELTDAEGSIRTIIDNSANVKDQVTYGAWGTTSQTNSSYGGRYLWVGREFDSATGLEYDRARYYDPGTARWISQDPLGFAAGDSNLYRYAGNDPVNLTDPSGEVGGVNNHCYPLYLGGSSYQPCIQFPSQAAHQAFHNYFSDQGFGWTNNLAINNQIRQRWRDTLTAAQRQEIIAGAMRAGQVPQSTIDSFMNRITKDSTPGHAQRRRGYPGGIYDVNGQQVRAPSRRRGGSGTGSNGGSQNSESSGNSPGPRKNGSTGRRTGQNLGSGPSQGTGNRMNGGNTSSGRPGTRPGPNQGTSRNGRPGSGRQAGSNGGTGAGSNAGGRTSSPGRQGGTGNSRVGQAQAKGLGVAGKINRALFMIGALENPGAAAADWALGRFLGRFGGAIGGVLLDPTPTAGGGYMPPGVTPGEPFIPRDTPEMKSIDIGMIILPDGRLVIPTPGSRPPPGSLIVIGGVWHGYGPVRGPFRPGSVAPAPEVIPSGPPNPPGVTKPSPSPGSPPPGSLRPGGGPSTSPPSPGFVNPYLPLPSPLPSDSQNPYVPAPVPPGTAKGEETVFSVQLSQLPADNLVLPGTLDSPPSPTVAEPYYPGLAGPPGYAVLPYVPADGPQAPGNFVFPTLSPPMPGSAGDNLLLPATPDGPPSPVVAEPYYPGLAGPPGYAVLPYIPGGSSQAPGALPQAPQPEVGSAGDKLVLPGILDGPPSPIAAQPYYPGLAGPPAYAVLPYMPGGSSQGPGNLVLPTLFGPTTGSNDDNLLLPGSPEGPPSPIAAEPYYPGLAGPPGYTVLPYVPGGSAQAPGNLVLPQLRQPGTGSVGDNLLLPATPDQPPSPIVAEPYYPGLAAPPAYSVLPYIPGGSSQTSGSPLLPQLPLPGQIPNGPASPIVAEPYFPGSGGPSEYGVLPYMPGSNAQMPTSAEFALGMESTGSAAFWSSIVGIGVGSSAEGAVSFP